MDLHRPVKDLLLLLTSLLVVGASARADEPLAVRWTREADASLAAELRQRSTIAWITSCVSRPSETTQLRLDAPSGIDVSVGRSHAGWIEANVTVRAFEDASLLVFRARWVELAPLSEMLEPEKTWHRDRSLILPGLSGRVAYRRTSAFGSARFGAGRATVSLARTPPKRIESGTIQLDILVLGPAGAPGPEPPADLLTEVEAPIPSQVVARHEWKSADVVFPAGTRSVRWHYADAFTYSDDRGVYLSSLVVGNELGWGTSVYPDEYARRTGLSNSVFHFGEGQLFGEGLRDGQVWDLDVRCDRCRKKTFFGFAGFDGEIVFEAPSAGFPKGSGRLPFKIAVGETKRIRFSVARDE